MTFYNAKQTRLLIYSCFNTKFYFSPPPVKILSKIIVYGQVQVFKRDEDLMLRYKTLIVFESFVGKLVNQESSLYNILFYFARLPAEPH